MSAVLICLVVTTFHLLVGILIPGLALELRLAQNQKLSNLVSTVLSRIIALGLLYLLVQFLFCLLYTSPSPRDRTRSRMPSSA